MQKRLLMHWGFISCIKPSISFCTKHGNNKSRKQIRPLEPSIWGLGCQKHVSQAGISNCIPHYRVGCNYLSIPEVPAVGAKVLISPCCSKVVNKIINSLWPFDYIWQHISRSTLAQVMTCCLMAPGHYVTQSLIIFTQTKMFCSIHLRMIP